MRRWFAPAFSVFCLLFAVPSFAQLSVVTVPGMQLVYLDPMQTFLVPHAAVREAAATRAKGVKARCCMDPGSRRWAREIKRYAPHVS